MHDVGKTDMSYEDICGYKDLQIIGMADRCPYYTKLDDNCNGYVRCNHKVTLKSMKRRKYPEDTWRDELDRHSKNVSGYIDEEMGMWY